MRLISSASLIFFLISGALLLGGCSAARMQAPLSENPETIDQEDFEGTWLLDGGVFQIRFGKDGIAQVAAMEWKGKRFEMERGEAIVTKGRPHNYLSLRSFENGEWQEGYWLLSYTFADNGDLVLWASDAERLKELVTKKELEGVFSRENRNSELLVTSPPDRLLEALNAERPVPLFDYKNPIVIRKIQGR